VRSPSQARLERAGFAAGLLFVLAAAVLCWKGVGWAFHQPTFLFADEIGNLPWSASWSYSGLFHFFPDQVYNDRPLGSALELFLYQLFAFDYTRQLSCFLLIHFSNCLLIYAILRRLDVSLPLSAACVGLFGALSTTAQTATYIGASFDVLCTFFLLASIFTILGEKRWCHYLSAVLFLLALRSKEFAIVTPVILTMLVAWRAAGGRSARQTLRTVLARLWLHYLVLIAFGARYLYFMLHMRDSIPASDPYYMDFRLATVVHSVLYYVALAFGREDFSLNWLPPGILLTLAVYGLVRRRIGVWIALAAFLLTILPVATLPRLRTPFYVYGPQVFLLLAICLLLEDVAGLVSKRSTVRWAATACAAAGLLCYGAALRRTVYYRSRIGFTQTVRSACALSAADARAKLGAIGPGSHIYLNHGNQTPYLMTAGPCRFLRILRHDDSISCVIGKPYEELRKLYDLDASEKYFVDYQPGGSLAVRLAGNLRPPPPRDKGSQ